MSDSNNPIDDLFNGLLKDEKSAFDADAWGRLQPALAERNRILKAKEKKKRLVFLFFLVLGLFFGSILLNQYVQKTTWQQQALHKQPKLTKSIADSVVSNQNLSAFINPNKADSQNPNNTGKKPNNTKKSTHVPEKTTHVKRQHGNQEKYIKRDSTSNYAFESAKKIKQSKTNDSRRTNKKNETASYEQNANLLTKNKTLNNYLLSDDSLSKLNSKKLTNLPSSENEFRLINEQKTTFERKPKNFWQKTKPTTFIQAQFNQFATENAAQFQSQMGISMLRETKAYSFGLGLNLGINQIDLPYNKLTDTIFGFGSIVTNTQVKQTNSVFTHANLLFGYKLNALNQFRLVLSPGIELQNKYEAVGNQQAAYDAYNASNQNFSGWKKSFSPLFTTEVQYQRWLHSNWYADLGCGFHFTYQKAFLSVQLKYRLP